jgi:hypothetical protein
MGGIFHRDVWRIRKMENLKPGKPNFLIFSAKIAKNRQSTFAVNFELFVLSFKMSSSIGRSLHWN